VLLRIQEILISALRLVALLLLTLELPLLEETLRGERHRGLLPCRSKALHCCMQAREWISRFEFARDLVRQLPSLQLTITHTCPHGRGIWGRVEKMH